MPVIDRIEWRTARFPIRGGLRNAASAMSEKHLMLVFAHDRHGRCGLGECWLEAPYRASVGARLDALSRPLLGLAADEALQRAYARQFDFADGGDREAMASLSGIDMALWDLKARADNRPLWRTIAETLAEGPVVGAPAPVVRCYASGGLYRPHDAVEDLVAEVELYRLMGHNAFKVKVGGAALAHDVARIAAVRDALGPEARLMVDANSALDPGRARQWIEALAPYDLAWFEEPLPLGAWAEMAALAQQSPIPLCGNEAETGHDRVLRLLDDRCVDVLQIDLSICGGISAAIAHAKAAREHGVPLTLHAASSAVLTLANLHLGAALQPAPLMECHMLHRWLNEHLGESDSVVRDGRIAPPSRPGLGLQLPPRGLEP